MIASLHNVAAQSNMRKALIRYLVFFSSCDVEPCPILNLHLAATSPVISRVRPCLLYPHLWTRVLPHLNRPPCNQDYSIFLPWNTAYIPKIAAMSLPSKWKYMIATSDTVFGTSEYLSAGLALQVPVYSPLTSLTLSSHNLHHQGSVCAGTMYVPNSSDNFIQLFIF